MTLFAGSPSVTRTIFSCKQMAAVTAYEMSGFLVLVLITMAVASTTPTPVKATTGQTYENREGEDELNSQSREQRPFLRAARGRQRLLTSGLEAICFRKLIFYSLSSSLLQKDQFCAVCCLLQTSRDFAL